MEILELALIVYFGLCHRLGSAVPSCAAAVVAARADRRPGGSGPGRSGFVREREHLLRAVPRAVHCPAAVQRGPRDEPRDLWENKGSILSLAVGLVLLTVLVVGFVLNWFVPSIRWPPPSPAPPPWPPPDAAAVAALASSVSLKRRQSTLLSGESLINDASGVCRLQFASAAALTGAFSALDAAEEFGRLFLGKYRCRRGRGRRGAVLHAMGPATRRLRAPPSTCSTRYSRRSSCTCSPDSSAPLLAFWL